MPLTHRLADAFLQLCAAFLAEKPLRSMHRATDNSRKVNDTESEEVVSSMAPPGKIKA